eukprot:12917672-Prorocentrum_lima.AAC.1
MPRSATWYKSPGRKKLEAIHIQTRTVARGIKTIPGAVTSCGYLTGFHSMPGGRSMTFLQHSRRSWSAA